MNDKPVIALGSCILKEEADSRDREVQRPVETQGRLPLRQRILQKRPPVGGLLGGVGTGKAEKRGKVGF